MGKLLADLYSIEGSSLNQIVQLLRPSKVRTVYRAKDFDLGLLNIKFVDMDRPLSSFLLHTCY